MHGSKLCRCHVNRFNDAPLRYAVTPGRTDALIEASFAAVRLLLNYLQRLNLKFRILKRLRSATRLSCFNIPVEALTPPNLFQNIERINYSTFATACQPIITYSSSAALVPYCVLRHVLPHHRAYRRAFYLSQAQPRLLYLSRKNKALSEQACSRPALQARKAS